MTTPIKYLSIEGVDDLIESNGLPVFRAKQILGWLYGKAAHSYSEMSNLPKTIREQFETLYPITRPQIVSRQESADGTCKYLLKFDDGAVTETVALPSQERLSVCISSQSGCAMACEFCATGKLGLNRNLFPGEIADQIAIVQEDLNRRVSNVVVMGQGEPLSNFDNTLDALRILNNPDLFGIGARHITISTCGLVQGIRKLAKVEEQFTLAVSLHSARQEIRDTLMPRLTNQSLDMLKRELNRYSERTGRRFSFEYALMKDINDSEADLKALIDYCTGLLCHINLIPLNEIAESNFRPAGQATLLHWETQLSKHGIPATTRKSRGSDIDAACGQLAARYLS